ncbi:hypothetical protein [Roseibacillus persicicus]|nr:hypothetical protein [Roseibacillus persicicus]
MKSPCLCLVFSVVGSSLCGAQEPPMAGNWQLAQLSVENRGVGDERIPDEISAELSPVNFLADGTFATGAESGRWFFSDNYLLAVQPGNVGVVAANTTGDTFIFAEADFEDLGGGDFTQKTTFNVGVKSPTTSLTATQVVGDWVYFQQEVDSIDSPSGGGTVRTWDGVSHQRIDVTFNANGTFTAEKVSDTDDPSEVGDLFGGTWTISGGDLEADAGGEVITLSHFSSGGDLLVATEEESYEVFEETFNSSKMDLWVKQPETLTTADLVGVWAIAGTTIDLEVDAGGGGQYLDDIGFEESELDFRADGTGTRRVVDNREPAAIGLTEDFTWSLVGNEVELVVEGQAYRFVMSAEKDFAAMQNFESNLGEESESFDYFAMVRLPDVAGFGRAPLDLVLIEEENGARPVLQTPTVQGVRYQVEMSEDLDDWQSLGPIMAGTGDVIFSNLPALPGEKTYFRWRILPPAPQG